MDESNMQKTENNQESDASSTKAGDNICSGITQITLDFVSNQLGLHPSAIFVDRHDASLMITLKNVLSDSEKYAVRDKHTAELIARTLSEAFRSVAGILKNKTSQVVGRNVSEASLLLDVSTNCASIFLEIDSAWNT